jgi:hypothetical protein
MVAVQGSIRRPPHLQCNLIYICVFCDANSVTLAGAVTLPEECLFHFFSFQITHFNLNTDELCNLYCCTTLYFFPVSG